MATQIGLLLPPRDSSLDGPVNGKQRKKTLSRNFTAWALFNFQALYVYILFEPALIKKPPDVPLPDPATNPKWYGQIWLKYPGDTKLHTTNTFPLPVPGSVPSSRHHERHVDGAVRLVPTEFA